MLAPMELKMNGLESPIDASAPEGKMQIVELYK
jgi:hypothetical protein